MAESATRWELCTTEPDAARTLDELAALPLEWSPATVPGTAAASLRTAERWTPDDDRDFDAQDWWWRTTVTIGDDSTRWVLDVGGIATVAEVWFAGASVLQSDSMFVRHRVPLGRLEPGDYELAIRCSALAPLLSVKRTRPRWKTRLVRHQNLRWFRTSLLGRMPGWSPTGAPVGPWRGCRVVPETDVVATSVRARCQGDDGIVEIRVELQDATAAGAAGATIAVGDVRVDAAVDGTQVRASVRVHDVERWWPHTHGTPALYDVTLTIDDHTHALGRVGFRTIEAVQDGDDFVLHVNGERVFCRGASWMPIDPVSLANDPALLTRALDDVRRGNMNMLRISGTTVYEDDAFYDRCDELGILVWQDLMFANLDPPDDPDFTGTVEQEVTQLLERIGHRPSLAVLCGGSEVEQQAAMLGLPRDRWTMPLFDEIIPAIRDRLVPGLPYLTSTPTGGALPFHSNAGVAHYYGVGAYLRPLTDARRANVRFASECLAFANVPDQYSTAQAVERDGVPHDNGVDWDFADVRDHYVRELFAVDPDELLATDPERYLELARAVTGELIEATLGEWRRAGSACAGALLWFLRDLRRGAGWGVVTVDGAVKPAWWYARRAMAPVAMCALDEGLNGLHLGVVNDTGTPIEARLRVDLYRDGGLLMESAERPTTIDARASVDVSVDGMFEGFRDLTWAYRFGELNYDVIAVTLTDDLDRPMARAFHLPLGFARGVDDAVALSATAASGSGGEWVLTLACDRFAQTVVIDVDGFRPGDNWFHLAPGAPRTVVLESLSPGAAAPRGSVRALNAGRARPIEVLT